MNCSRLKDYIFDLTKLFMFFSYSQKMTLWLYAPSTILHLCIVFFFVYPVQVSVQSKGSERSCICVLEIMYLCQRSCICVLEVMYLCVRGHIFVCQRSRICVLEVMYLCVRGHVFVCQRSCFCVLGYRFDLFLRFVYWILDLFRQCGFFFLFNCIAMVTT